VVRRARPSWGYLRWVQKVAERCSLLIFRVLEPSIRGGLEDVMKNPSGPVNKRLLQVVFFSFITAVAFAQAPPKYNAATETTLKGTVTELKFLPPTGAKSIAYVMTKTGPDKDKDVVEIFLCPKKFLDDLGIVFKADDAIQVTGSQIKQDTGSVLLAREVVRNGETITLRFQDGRPAW
jgi:hypothetical protein